MGFGGQFGYYTEQNTKLSSDPRDRGLILCTFRYYDPINARWLTRDPVGYDGDINLYGYTSGNPVMNADPSGLVDGPDALLLIVDGTFIVDDVRRKDWCGFTIDTVAFLFDATPGTPAVGGTIIHGGEAAVRAGAIINRTALGIGQLAWHGGVLITTAGSGNLGTHTFASKSSAPKGGTYILRDSATNEVKRTGMAANLTKRKSDHKKEFPNLDFEIDRRSDDREARRGREHILYERHPEARIPNGYNKQGAISTKPANNTPEEIERMLKKGRALE